MWYEVVPLYLSMEPNVNQKLVSGSRGANPLNFKNTPCLVIGYVFQAHVQPNVPPTYPTHYCYTNPMCSLSNKNVHSIIRFCDDNHY
jgi:hypothetical protein